MSRPVFNFVRVDAEPSSLNKNACYLRYVWRCAECGEEYNTLSVSKSSEICPSCREARYARNAVDKLNQQKKEQLTALKSLWKDMMTFSDIDEITIGKEKYVSRKALEKNFKNLLAKGNLSQ